MSALLPGRKQDWGQQHQLLLLLTQSCLSRGRGVTQRLGDTGHMSRGEELPSRKAMYPERTPLVLSFALRPKGEAHGALPRPAKLLPAWTPPGHQLGVRGQPLRLL